MRRQAGAEGVKGAAEFASQGQGGEVTTAAMNADHRKPDAWALAVNAVPEIVGGRIKPKSFDRIANLALHKLLSKFPNLNLP